MGFYLSFLFIMGLASALDFMIENYDDAYIEIVFLIFTLISFIHYQHSKNLTMGIYAMVILTTLITYLFLISNNFSVSIFHTIVPLGYFLLFSLKRSLVYAFIHHSIVLALYLYAYYHNLLHLEKSTLVAIVLASLLIILFGVVYHIAVENSYRQLDKSNQQKELLLKEVHHRVKNNLNIISSILGLQLIGEANDKVKQLLQKNRLRIESIAMVHELLYKHNDFETINVYEYLSNLVEMVVELHDYNVKVTINREPIQIPFEDILKLGIITNELAINSIKYAFKQKEGAIDIVFIKESEGYCYHYSDSEKSSIDINKLENSNRLGFKLVMMMVEQMNATIDIHNGKGLSYTIRIPLESND